MKAFDMLATSKNAKLSYCKQELKCFYQEASLNLKLPNLNGTVQDHIGVEFKQRNLDDFKIVAQLIWSTINHH